MNILHITTHLNAGGITSYLCILTKGLIQQGCSVHIISSGGEMEKEFSKMGAKVYNLNIKTKSEISPKIYSNLSRVKKYINENKIDVIHAHTRIAQMIGFLMKKMNRTSFVSTCHGFFRVRLGRRMLPCWGDKVIAISEAVTKHLNQDFRVSSEDIVLVKSGIELEKFKGVNTKHRNQFRQKFGIQDEPVIGIIARLSDVKGQDVLVSAMHLVVKKYSNAKLMLVGEGKLEPLLKKLVKDYQLDKNIIFYPVVNQTQDILSMFDIFVMPSRQEGLGLSIIEAQAMGLPVVASNIGGIPHVIEDKKTGILFDPEDVNGLAKALMSLIENKQQAKTIGDAARAYVQIHFSSDRMIKETIQVYEQLVSDGVA